MKPLLTMKDLPKTTRVILIILFALSVALALYFVTILMWGIRNYIIISWHPSESPSSFWSTDEGEISFFVEEEEQEIYSGCYKSGGIDINYSSTTLIKNGEIVIDAEVYQFYARYDNNSHKSLVLISTAVLEDARLQSEHIEDIEKDYILAEFELVCKSKKRFIAEVEGGSLFEIGTRFEFRRTEP